MKHNNTTVRFMYYNGNFVKFWKHDGVDVFYSGADVTYHVDGADYTEFVTYGQSCLAPTSFTPTKDGWTFAGWREDTAANGTVLTSKVMGTDPISLYAVFKQDITVTYYDNKDTASYEYGTRYYNNSNVANPSFTLTQTDDPNWVERGWSTSNKGDASITYDNKATFTRDSDITLYGLYSQNIRLTYVANGSSSYKDGTRYWAPAGYINPTFTVSNPTKSGATFQGWSATAGSTSIAMGTISGLTINNAYTSMTYYAVFKYSDAPVPRQFFQTHDPFMPEDGWLTAVGYMTLVPSVDFSKYSGITINFDSVGVVQDYLTCYAYIVAECGGASVDLYYSYLEYTGTLYNSATSGSKTLNFNKTSGSAVCRIGFRGNGHCSNGSFGASGTLLGRTVVG